MMPWLRRVYQEASKGGRYRRQRPADRREDLIILPAGTQRFVERHELIRRALLGEHVFLLNQILLPLRIDDVERIRQSAIKAFGGKCDCASRRG
jgi:hypothetical protein